MSLFGFYFHCFGHEDWVVHEETGFKLDLKVAVEEDLLRKSSFLACAGFTPDWITDASTFLMNCFEVSQYVFQHH